MAKVSGKVMQFSSQPKGKNALHVLAAVAVAGLLIFGLIRAKNSTLFQLKKVSVAPISEGYPLTAEQVLQLAKIQIHDQNLFQFDMKPVEERLLKNPWIKGVVIGKEFPDTISLKVIERSPIALVNGSRGKVSYLEEDGTVFEDHSIVYAKDLPILQGFTFEDQATLGQLRSLLFEWFKESSIPGLRVSSVSFDTKLGLRAVVSYPMKNGKLMRPVIEMGINIDEALTTTQFSRRKVLEYLSGKSLPASKIWLGDGKKIVVKMSRDS